jgi:adenylate cyclase
LSQIFISYARTTEPQARLVAESLRALGYGVWRDDELPPHRAYSDVIEERIRAARAVVVVWSSDAVKSQWVRAEADLARQAGTLIQLSIDGAVPPLPFTQIHCVDLAGWTGEGDAPDWRKVADSVAELLEQAPTAASPAPLPPPPLPDKPSLAVLPFTNLSNDPDQELPGRSRPRPHRGRLGCEGRLPGGPASVPHHDLPLAAAPVDACGHVRPSRYGPGGPR